MDMLVSVLIVDDEYLIRSLIRKSVDWEGLGFRIVGEAEDGETAIRLVDELRPRLVILDINIPFFNGLEVTRRLRSSHPEVKIIILTGYEDFQYALQAIKAGVLNYILKPINPEEFEIALAAAKDAILNEEKSSLSDLSGDAVSLPVRERFLRLLLTEGHSLAENVVLDRFRLFRCELVPADFVVALFEIRRPEKHWTVLVSSQELKEILTGLPPEWWSDFPPYEFFSDETGRLVLLMNEDASTTRRKDKAYYRMAEVLMSSDRLSGRYVVSCGFGLAAAKAAEIPRSYREAETALEESFYSGAKRIRLFEDVPQRSKSLPQADFFDAAERDGFLLMLRGGKEGEAETFLKNRLRGLAALRPPRHYCEMNCMELIGVVLEFMEENNLVMEEFFEDKDVFSVLRSLGTLKELEDWIIELIGSVQRKIDLTARTRTRQVVQKAKLYIERNYGRSFVTLEQAAEHLSVTATYLSTIFKKELGISLIQYLTEFRLKKAKELMDADPLLPIMDVAGRVGYSDPYYFSKCFRKHFGLSPSAYLRRKATSGSE